MRRIKNYLFAFVVIGLLVRLLGEGSLGTRESIDLGIAQYPSFGESAFLHAEHQWEQPISRASYQLVYRHGENAARSRHSDHARLGRKFGYSPGPDGRFSWRNARDCQTDWQFSPQQTWACVYSQVLARNEDDIAPILEKVRTGMVAEQMSAVEAARWLLDFVQNIPYKIPERHAFGLLPPSLVASENWGDCDSKSLLLIALLRHFGIEAHMMISNAHEHAMVAVPMNNASRATFRINGRGYTWAETTAKAPLGWIKPELLRPNDWRVVWVAQR